MVFYHVLCSELVHIFDDDSKFYAIKYSLILLESRFQNRDLDQLYCYCYNFFNDGAPAC